MIIGEGTNEIQRTLIARQLLARQGERRDAEESLTAAGTNGDENRELVRAVSQFVDRVLAPAAMEHEPHGRLPDDVLSALADLGVLGTLVPQEQGGLGLDLPTHATIVEEVARGWAAAAALASAHLSAVAVVARSGTRAQRERILPPATRGETLLAGMWDGSIEAERAGDGLRLRGEVALVDNATRAAAFVARVTLERTGAACVIVPRDAPGVTVSAAHETLGVRGVGMASVRLDDVLVPAADVLPAARADDDVASRTGRALSRLAAAAIAVGVAEAAFAAALRYSQERSTFGKPICEHQAVQLKLADMATAITVARLLTRHAAALADRDGAADESGVDATAAIAMAKLAATESALAATLESMRIHGGYGYSAEFPVERYYRDAARLVLTPTTSDEERVGLARQLVRG